MALTTYRKKRDFGTTPEPRGGESKRTSRARHSFVIHKHAATRLHYDLRLELDGVLKSWAVPKGPSQDPGDKRLAVEVEDHPLEYGSFEGLIPKGEYGGGAVVLWDRGYWVPSDDPHKGLKKGHLRFELHGEKLKGEWNLLRMRKENGGKTPWLLVKAKDAFARAGGEDILVSRPESVKSGRTIEDLEAGRNGKTKSRKPAAETSGSRASTSAPRSSRRKPHRGSVDPASIPGARRSALPPWTPPQLATLTDRAPEGDEWLHEIKYDGYRAVCRVENGKARLLTRSGQDWTGRFATIAEAARDLPLHQALLDGEVVVQEPDGRTSFQALQNALGRDGDDRLVYFAFDLLHLDGFDLTKVPLEARKAALARLVPGDSGPIRYSDHVTGMGVRFHGEACRRGLEGIVSKLRQGLYTARRTRDWLKVKCSERQEFVIGGFTEPRGSRAGIGALLVGVREGDGLRYSGRVGTGFTAEMLGDLRQRLERIEIEAPPFENAPRGRDVHWVKPELVAEVSFTERTRDGMLRHPSFQGLREDKPAREVVAERPSRSVGGRAKRAGKDPVREPDSEPPIRDPERRRPPAEEPPAEDPDRDAPIDEPEHDPPIEEPPRKRPPVREPEPRARARSGSRPKVGAAGAVAGVKLTNPDKVLYPDRGLTKLDLARYIESVSSLMLPQIAERPLMLLRCPEGAGRNCFFQKHPGSSSHASLGQVKIRESKGVETYLFVEDAAGLVALVQMGALEIHVWGSRADDVERPDRMVFDLDPAPETPWGEVREAAQELRKRLSALDLESFLKTTGGKGLHVVVPIRRGPGWEDVKQFSAGVAAGMVRDAPDRYTLELGKARRKGRMFLDVLRNGRGATWIAPYSTRARDGAPVSTPIGWKELSGRIGPASFTVENLAQRLRSADPWRGMSGLRQTLTATMLREATRGSR